MILDAQVPTADPGELIIQFTPLLHYIARRYREIVEKQPSIDEDDLLQAGRIAIYNCQKTYDPNGGASFMTYAFDRIRGSMRRVLGFRSDGILPPILESLDEPLDDESDATRLDLVPDTTPTAEERIVDQDEHDETAEAVHAAVDRLKNPTYRETIRRVWFDGQDKDTAAAEMGCNVHVLRQNDLQARYKLKRDKDLKAYAALQYPIMRVGAGRFRSTWTSGTEATVLWRERRYDWEYGTGAFVAAGRPDHGNVQTSILREATT